MEIEIPDMMRVGKEAKETAAVIVRLNSKLGFMDDTPAMLQGALNEGLRLRRKRIERASK